MNSRRIIDLLQDRIPFYDRLSGQFDDTAILGHAAAKFPATLTDIIVTEAVKSGEVDPEFLGGIFNFVKKAAGAVIGVAKNVIGGVAQTHKIQIIPQQPVPSKHQMAQIAAAAPKPPGEEKKGLSVIAIIGMAIGGVILALFVFLIASNK